VHAENLLVNDSGTREAVEAIREGLPKFNSESSLTLIVKSIDTIDRSTFMIAAENEKAPITGIIDVTDPIFTVTWAINQHAIPAVAYLEKSSLVLIATRNIE